jgi:hypothetical protein
MSNGKGSKARPLSISYEEYSKNWENIFRKNKKAKNAKNNKRSDK